MNHNYIHVSWLLCFRVFIVIVLGLLVAWLAVDTRKRPEQLISFAGVCLFIIAIFLFSAHRTAVSDKKHIPALHALLHVLISEFICFRLWNSCKPYQIVKAVICCLSCIDNDFNHPQLYKVHLSGC